MNITTVESMYGTVHAFEGDLITDHIVKYGNHQRPGFAFMHGLLKPGMSVFDIGAHIGTFSIGAAQKVGRLGKFVCVEANPDTFALLSKNVSNLIQCEVHAINATIGTKPGYRYEVANPGNTGGGGLVKAESQSDEDDVNAVSIDVLVEKYFEPDFIKLDIEGAEVSAILGSSYITEKRPVFCCEISKEQIENYGDTPRELFEFISKSKYRTFVNRSPRNVANDYFVIEEIDPFDSIEGALTDILCVPHEHAEAGALASAAARDIRISRASPMGSIYRKLKHSLMR